MEDNLLKRSLRQLLIAHSRQLEGSWRVSQGMCYSAPDKSHCARDMSSFDVVIAHMPKSVGWLQLPGGTAMPARGQISLYKRATDARNPGAVRRFNPERFEEKPKNKLEGILKRFESVEKKKF